jgi:AcrR family transcriptional regulator
MSPRPRLTDQETSEHAHQLVEATFRVIAATGDADPPVRPILREAGLSRQVLYRCFGSKDELMAAVFAEGCQLLTDYLAARLARASTPEAKVRAWITGVMRQAQVERAAERTRPFIASLGQRGAVNPAVFAESQRLHTTLLTEAIASGSRDGSWESFDPESDATIIHDYVIASLSRHLLLGIPPSREATQALVDFAFRALNISTAPYVSTEARSR